MTEQKPRGAPIRGRLAQGAGLLLAASVLGRVLAMASIAVLGRLLAPEDFGLIAYATIGAEILRVTGGRAFTNALIRVPEIDQSHIDTAFTLGVLASFASALVLAVAAAPLAAWAATPALGPVLTWLAVIAAVEGLRTPRFTLLARELRFDWAAAADVFGRVVLYGTAIALAFAIGDYRAMLAGMVLAAVLGTGLTHLATPGTLGFSLRRWRDCLGFGGWTMAHRLTAVLNRNIGALFVGSYLGLGALGAYRIALNLLNQLFQRFTQPIDRMVFAGIAHRARDRAQTRRAYLDAQALVFGCMLPAGVGVALTAPELLRVLAGPQWGAAVPVLQILAPAMAVGLLGAGARGLLQALGMARLIFLREAGMMVVALPVLWWGVSRYGVLGAAAAGVVAELVGLALLLPIVARQLGGTIGEMLRVGARSALAAGAMTVAVVAFDVFVISADAGRDFRPALVALGLKAGLGAAVYAVAHLVFWQLAGRPRGFETIFAGLLTSALRRLRRG